MAHRAKVDIYRGWCKRCGICIAFCPKNVLKKDDSNYPVVADPAACTGCKWCELRCPDFAILVHDNNKENNGKSGTAAGK